MSFQSKIQFQETSRDYRTEAPNIVFELLKCGALSANDLVLYLVYRRIAGEHGSCWVGTRGLADMCKLSAPTITKSKKVLSRKLMTLNGKSLIEITACDREKETSDIVTIIDIWPENHAFFKNRLTCEKVRYTGVQNGDTGVCKSRPHKNEPYKKELRESKSPIVHKSDPPNTEPPKTVVNSYVPPAASAAHGSIPFHGKDKNENNTSELVDILEMENDYLPFFRPEIVSRWITKFGSKLVLDTIRYFFYVKSVQKCAIPKPEAWMETAFKKKFAEVNATQLENKKFAEDLKKKHRLTNLKINKRYCQDTETSKEYYYNLPQHTFQGCLKEMYGIR